MATNPTTGELYQAKALTDEDLAAAVDAFMTDPTTTLFLFSNGYQLDIAAAIRSHPFSNATISGGNATRTRKRAAIRTAILLARPERGGSRNLHRGAEWSFCLTAARMAADQER